jgi:hypothetical protein
VWWRFLENLSGPGPFMAVTGGIPIACGEGDRVGTITRTRSWCWDDAAPGLRQIISLRPTVGWTIDDRPRLSDTPQDRRDVWFVGADAVGYFRLHPMLDVGAGGGITRFAGEGFEAFWRPTFIPVSVTVAPFAGNGPAGSLSPARRFLKLRFEGAYFPIGFTGADFGHPESSYQTSGEWVFSAGVVLNLTSLR